MNVAATAAALGRAKAKGAGFDLFDDEEEEEEEAGPFGKTSKNGGSADSEKNPREKKSLAVSGLFSEDEDEKEKENNLSSSSSTKPKESVKKKPIGGVSLFGDVDIFAKKKKLPEKQEEAKKVEATKPRQSTLSLFDDDEDEEGGEAEDLFSPLSKPAAGVTPTAPKPEAKARTKSLFEDEDVLFGAPEEDPSVDLFSSQGPLASNKKIPPATAPTKSKLTEPGTNLFDNTKKNSEAKKTEVNEAAAAAGAGAANRILNIDGVAESDSVDSDVAKETKADAAAPRAVKKPIGGVSLFGGADPFAEIRKKKKAAAAVEKDTDENENPAIKSVLEKSGEISPTTTTTTTTSKEPISASAPPPPPKSKKPLRVEIPRPQPPTSFGPDKLESPGVSFDQPPTPQPLQSATVTKERARILSRRRPQSRKARRAAAGSEFDSTDFSPISPLTAVPYANEGGAFSPVNPIDAMSAPVLYADQDQEDPFDYKELLNSRTKPSALSTPTQEAHPAKTSSSSSSEAKDPASREARAKRSSTPSSSSEAKDPASREAHLAKTSSTSTSSSSEAKDPTSREAHPAKTSSSSSEAKDPTSREARAKRASSPFRDQLFGTVSKNMMPSKNDADELFGPSSVQRGTTNAKDSTATIKADERPSVAKATARAEGIGKKDVRNNDKEKEEDDDDDDDDDIFADASITVNKQKDKKTEIIKHDDDDDIFASSSLSSKLSATDSKSRDLKPATNKNKTSNNNNNNNNNSSNNNNNPSRTRDDDNLFEDDTDIFANLPSTKNKDRKNESKKTSSKTLFKEDDDVDDIFADSVPSKKECSAKMDNGATKSEKTSKKVASIFDDEDDDDDDDSLFDDPLSVKSK